MNASIQIRRGKAMPNLPTFYYHKNFADMLDFVEARYRHVFDDNAEQFLNDFSGLPFPAQCLYVRFASRKGHVFDLSRLTYPELPDLHQISYELKKTGFIHGVTKHDFDAYLTSITKPDLLALLGDYAPECGVKASWKKAAILDIARHELDAESVDVPDTVLVQGRRTPLQFLSFLYFGRIEPNFQRFTLRDLGVISVPDFKDDYGARFDMQEAAQSAYFYANALYQTKHGKESETTRLIDQCRDWPEPACDIGRADRDKLVMSLGKLCEQLSDTETALAIYAQGECADSLEREIRIRYARGETEWCKTRLEALIDNPDNDTQMAFAEDFYARKFDGKRTSAFTDMLRDGETITLDAGLSHRPEYAAKSYYEAQGFEVHRTENAPWKMLFGLLFWDLLFERDGAEIFNSFQRLPTDLKCGRFYDNCKDAIESKLAKLSEPKQALKHILLTYSRHHGEPNGIFLWRKRSFDQAQCLLTFSNPKALAQILRDMCRNYTEAKDGYPDLMLLKDGTLSFIEVKSTGDVIRRNQLIRIRRMREVGFDVSITNVNWGINPDQTYVVVDIETTGGRGTHHRITEIGAVKVRDGKVIDEFQTLLNPERHVPAFITGLTGITNEMVANAPLFADIADDFRAFLGDAVFVAHNVNFDYGFIKAEYGRLGQRFQFAKLCTCASMRRFYPGLKSYSLGKLCREFDIDLTQHHRAMCDAKAATELLHLINDKRAPLAN